MSVRTILIVLLALVFGVSAAVGIQQFLKDPGTETTKKEDPKPVIRMLVAASDIPEGTRITESKVVVKDVLESTDNPPESERLTDKNQVVGRYAKFRITKGDYVLDSKISLSKEGDLAAMITKGKQAISLESKNLSTPVAGFIKPNNHVDVLITFTDTNIAGDEAGGAINVKLPKLRVLAVDRFVSSPKGDPVEGAKDLIRSVTVEVTQLEATAIALGQTKGTLQLVLRPTDKEEDPKPATNPVLLSMREWIKTMKPADTSAGTNDKKEVAPPIPTLLIMEGGGFRRAVAP